MYNNSHFNLTQLRFIINNHKTNEYFVAIILLFVKFICHFVKKYILSQKNIYDKHTIIIEQV